MTRLFEYGKFLLVGLVLLSCDDDENEAPPTAELNIVADVTQDDSGMVQFELSAADAQSYKLLPGDGSDTLVNTSGTFEYTYMETGEYTAVGVAEFGEGAKVVDSITLSVVVVIDPATLGNQVPENGYDAPDTYPGYSLTWSDEFDGSVLNPDNWNYELGNVDPFGNVGWGNNELQQYGESNATVGNGYLTIEVRQEENGSYSSARINTRDKQEYRYGRIDVRAALPNQRGMWPAIWMLGENHLEDGWPVCGEIDIVEAFIDGPATANEIKSNAFWGNSFPAPNAPSPPFKLSEGDFSDEWHVFSLQWTENSLRYFVDGNQHYALTINAELGAHFRNEFFFIMNVAVGGNPVPSPDATTILPQRMFVDYIRVYQEE